MSYNISTNYGGHIMKNISKVILILVFVMLLIVIFFALTGINVRQPEQAMYIMIDKLGRLNRTINQMFRELLWSIRTTVTGWFGQ